MAKSKLTDMRITKAERDKRKEKYSPSIAGSYDGPEYPYGLTLRLENDALDKLDLDDLPPVGKSVQLVCVCEVTSVSQSSTSTRGADKDTRRSLELQIKKIALDLEGGDVKDAVDAALDELNE